MYLATDAFYFPLISSVVELASESVEENCYLPATLRSNLVHLTLVCLKHCTCKSSSSSALNLSSDDLFDAAVKLLCALPEVIPDVFSHLLIVLSGMKLLRVLDKFITNKCLYFKFCSWRDLKQ